MAQMQMRVPELVVQLVREHVGISAINLFRPRVSTPIQNNSDLSEAELRLIDGALALRDATAFPFWDCLMQVTSTAETEAENLLRIARRHNRQNVERVPRESVKLDMFEAMISNLRPDEVLALSSKTEYGPQKVMHVPMLDFHCNVSAMNDKRVRLIIQNLDLLGYIVHSGKSYHFYGSVLVEINDLLMILAKALLFAPIVDRAWVAHQLIEGACGLRISPGKTYSRSPEVVDEV